MIKFSVKANERKLLGFALSEQNIILLKEGKPIHSDLSTLGIPDWDVLIFYGKTEDEIIETLKEHKLIKDESEIHDPHLKQKEH